MIDVQAIVCPITIEQSRASHSMSNPTRTIQIMTLMLQCSHLSSDVRCLRSFVASRRAAAVSCIVKTSRPGAMTASIPKALPVACQKSQLQISIQVLPSVISGARDCKSTRLPPVASQTITHPLVDASQDQSSRPPERAKQVKAGACETLTMLMP